METSEDNEQFKSSLGDWQNWLKPPYLYTAFNKATAELSWTQVLRAVKWVEEGNGTWEMVLPIPDIDPSETEYWDLTLQGELHRQAIENFKENRKQKWLTNTKNFFLNSRQLIKRRRKQLKQLFDNELEERKVRGLKTSLTAKKAVIEWNEQNRDITITELKNLHITTPMVNSLLDEIIKNWVKKYGRISNRQDGLTDRERALIHCYNLQPPIKKGEKLYNDYCDYATPIKRLAYSNDSSKKANSLIKSIEKILPYLNEKAKLQAESEIITIRAKFSN
ncbi:hypothetical protein [Spirosoma panaciterrae]|uniref:hypothetical protein n=1 Tax=Spirosoma panaciterrae TaxID=496058 RepID=UPI0003636AE2|nr:hypothetical protein [Spirosoma panaciterrae]